MIRKEVEKLRGFEFTEEELKEIILPAIVADPCKEKDFEMLPSKVKKMIDLAKEFKENGIIPDSSLLADFRKIGITFPRVKVGLPKEVIANSTREELQEILNKYIEAGIIPSDTTPDDVIDESMCK